MFSSNSIAAKAVPASPTMPSQIIVRNAATIESHPPPRAQAIKIDPTYGLYLRILIDPTNGNDANGANTPSIKHRDPASPIRILVSLDICLTHQRLRYDKSPRAATLGNLAEAVHRAALCGLQYMSYRSGKR